MTTTSLLIAVALLLFVIIALFISAYNSLNRKRNQIENAKSSLDALFIKRNDLIPNLIEITMQYTRYEKETLDKITQLRRMPQTPTDYQQTDELSKIVKTLILQAENYPALQAHTQFTNLQYSWNEAEEQIAAGRRYLSASITQYNNAVKVFPSNIIAGMFHFSFHEWERASDDQRKAINAKELMH
jgi:LemA protein